MHENGSLTGLRVFWGTACIRIFFTWKKRTKMYLYHYAQAVLVFCFSYWFAFFVLGSTCIQKLFYNLSTVKGRFVQNLFNAVLWWLAIPFCNSCWLLTYWLHLNQLTKYDLHSGTLDEICRVIDWILKYFMPKLLI